MLFVAVYLAQWWSYVVFAVWLLISEPHMSIRVGAVLFSNMGGVFNMITYIMMLRQKQNSAKVDTERKTQTQAGPRRTGASDKTGLVKHTKTTESSSA